MKRLAWGLMIGIALLVGWRVWLGDPADNTLAAGTTAVVAAESGAKLTIKPEPSDLIYPWLSAGVRVTVGYDPGWRQGGPSRQVKVTVESGKYAGRSGAVTRYYLQAVR